MSLSTQGEIRAADLQSHDSIRESVRAHAETSAPESDARIEIKVGMLDKRLRLHRCEQALETFAPPGRQSSNRQTVGVRCTGSKPWTIYVPVTVSQYVPILVTTHQLQRGSTVGQADIQLKDKDISRLHRGYFKTPAEVVGKIVKRTTQANQVLLPSQLVAANAIKKGSLVTILAKTGGIQVRMKGKALSSGAVGERVQVKNLSSERKIEGIVVGSDLVEVSL
ncbi:flagellar basal body P-ring formation chaperone FlgA [Solemya velesiana gill symbiont]|uniref:flagellar basal body P-ring formation chaperone FlgA n=1 Tax=Solemya velesiana gill symbiont TaxID=1918948 RepID=UPI001560EA86|nr:flagellar basal body P-ring formation chaperone FlgA [Solemya velesiana gill symbiont]